MSQSELTTECFWLSGIQVVTAKYVFLQWQLIQWELVAVAPAWTWKLLEWTESLPVQEIVLDRKRKLILREMTRIVKPFVVRQLHFRVIPHPEKKLKDPNKGNLFFSETLGKQTYKFYGFQMVKVW